MPTRLGSPRRIISRYTHEAFDASEVREIPGNDVCVDLVCS